MSGVIVYNPEDSPIMVDATGQQVDGRGWLYVENKSAVQAHLDRGFLVEVEPLANIADARSEARPAFDAYEATNARQKVVKRNDTTKKSATAEKSRVRDTEVSGTAAPATDKEA
jgi:hypothetical protein